MSWRPIESWSETQGLHVLGADGRAVGEMHWTDDGWYWAGNDPTDAWGGRIYPDHWQPLPEPPSPTV